MGVISKYIFTINKLLNTAVRDIHPENKRENIIFHHWKLDFGDQFLLMYTRDNLTCLSHLSD